MAGLCGRPTQTGRVEVIVVVESGLANTGYEDRCPVPEAESGYDDDKAYFDIVLGKFGHDYGKCLVGMRLLSLLKGQLRTRGRSDAYETYILSESTLFS